MRRREKTVEFRRVSKWITSRLVSRDGSKRDYDLVHFRNGYARSSPEFLATYKGFEKRQNVDITYSNGLHAQFDECFAIEFE
jgi:hypothetical protein